MGMGRGVGTGFEQGGITCVLQTQFSSFTGICLSPFSSKMGLQTVAVHIQVKLLLSRLEVDSKLDLHNPCVGIMCDYLGKYGMFINP